MGLNWQRNKTKRAVNADCAATRDADAYLRELDGDARGPSKAEMREQAAIAMAAYTGPIRRLPTVHDLRCPGCRHRGKVKVPHGQARPRFKCSRCGTRM